MFLELSGGRVDLFLYEVLKVAAAVLLLAPSF